MTNAPTQQGPSTWRTVRSVSSLLTPMGITPAPPTHKDVPFREERAGRGIPPVADVYLPEGPGPHPSVVLIHGGGWVLGNRRMKPMKYLATKLVEEGYAVCVPEYRMVFRGGRLDEALDDVVTAIRWWLAAADRYALDVDRVSLSGLSAGGTLMLLGAHALRDEHRFVRVVPVFAVYDFAAMNGGLGRLIGPLFLRDHAPDSVSPLHLPPPTSPVAILHGTDDGLVPFPQAEAAAAAWTEQGAEVELIAYDGMPHAFFNDPKIAAVPTVDFLRVMAP